MNEEIVVEHPIFRSRRVIPGMKRRATELQLASVTKTRENESEMAVAERPVDVQRCNACGHRMIVEELDHRSQSLAGRLISEFSRSTSSPRPLD